MTPKSRSDTDGRNQWRNVSVFSAYSTYSALLKKTDCDRTKEDPLVVTGSRWELFLKNPLKVCFLFDADVALCAAFSSLSVLLFQRRPEPCIGFTPLRLSWRCDRPWEARIHSVLILSPSPIGFDWPQHMHSNPYSTANKSLSSDTIRGKVCWRSPAQTLSVFGPDLFWSTPFSVAGCLTWKDRHASGSNPDENCDVFAALMVWITIKLIWMRVSAPFFFCGGGHFICTRSLSPPRIVSMQLFTLHTRSVVARHDLSARNFARKVTLHILSSDHLWRGIMADACSPGYMCPPQRATH